MIDGLTRNGRSVASTRKQIFISSPTHEILNKRRTHGLLGDATNLLLLMKCFTVASPRSPQMCNQSTRAF